MGCLFAIVALITPRFILIILWLFTNYLNTAFSSGWWGLLGFLFLPTTTIAYAIAQNEFTTVRGGVEATGIILIVLGIVIDLGLIGGSGRGVARRG
ncbi:MAG TPA: hypothetical protein VFY08_05185 [Actinomycetota bacterium]|nr:hypothetical protein [Actinomycetota bacterium]